jgi:hypothetical protein
MNAMTTVSVGAASSTAIRQPRLMHYKIKAKKGLLRRFQHFIELTDWEERYLCNHWIDKICLGGIVVSVSYFNSVLTQFLLK